MDSALLTHTRLTQLNSSDSVPFFATAAEEFERLVESLPKPRGGGDSLPELRKGQLQQHTHDLKNKKVKSKKRTEPASFGAARPSSYKRACRVEDASKDGMTRENLQLFSVPGPGLGAHLHGTLRALQQRAKLQEEQLLG